MNRKIISFLLLPAVFFISYFMTIESGAYQHPQPSAKALTPTPNPTQIAQVWGQPLHTIPQNSSGLEASIPVRGVAGDIWADVVIGQPSFEQITPNQVVANKVFNPGGVLVDRSVIPNRVYVYDAGNSRVLGFSSLGACATGSKAGMACTSNSDCPSSTCAIESTRPPEFIIGQPSSAQSMCNSDSGYQHYPALPSPSAETLCGLRPESISILEGGSMVTMAVDAHGNFYHPDYFNNRVLRYNNPFTTDQVADFVWGQVDFVHGNCNRGRGYFQPDNESLCIAAPLSSGAIKSGVAIDLDNNLWITDTQNNRVLRFPYNPVLGAASPVSDLVLGQQNFTSAEEGNGLNEMTRPASVRVDASGKVYVLDGVDGWQLHGRLLVFTPPLFSGMAATQVFTGIGEPTSLELDSSGDLWINNTDRNEILRLSSGEIVKAIPWIDNGAWGGLGIDRDNNVMTGGWSSQEIQIYSAPSYLYSSATFLQADFYGAYNELGSRGLAHAQGLEVTDTQLIVSDGERLLFWNNPWQLISKYPPAEGVIGQPDFFTRPKWDPLFGRMRADTNGKLWVVKGNVGLATQIVAYQLPLVSQAEPIIEIASPLPLKGGGSFNWTGALHLGGIAYQPECDCLWLSDTEYSRVFRINHVSLPNRTVDIVLGQGSVVGTHCNEGRDSDDGYIHPQSPSQDSLCHPGGLAFDRHGNLFVSDHNLELSGNWRMLEYSAAGLPANPSTAIFGLPASQVYGRDGSFTEPDCLSGDPMCGPWEPVFDPNNEMVIGFNGYLGSPLPQVYHDPLVNALPYTSLMDFYSHAYSARLDPQNNLYVLDLTRNRVLIYRAEDTTSPTIISVSRLDPNPSSFAVVKFRITFSEPVTDITGIDFALTSTGITDSSVSSISGSGSSRIITVNTGSGNGTIRLDVPSTATILDVSGNPLGNLPFTSGEAYIIDKTTTFSLIVDTAGSGDGMVTSPGINCPQDCLESYLYNTQVVLTPTASIGSTFAGWSGNADCVDGVVTMNANKTCTAIFNINYHTLNVTKTGTAGGTVTSIPTGINCGSDCSESYAYNTQVTLTASPTAGSAFLGWSGGGCSGPNTCTVTMTASVTVVADFKNVIDCPATITAWKGEYWDNTDLSGPPTVCRDDPEVNFVWGGGTPDPLITSDQFSARWTRLFYFDSGLYRFYINHDDGARLYIDNNLVPGGNFWNTCCVWDSVDKQLQVGDHIIRLEMFDNGGSANVELLWERIGPSFADVATDYWSWHYIERLYAAGVTSGCGNGNYCPTTTVTRDQMAVFLLKGKHGSSYVPPTATGVFQDVPANYWAAAWIEQLAAEGITAGCGGGNYCPTTPVTRDQMAVFLLKAKHGSNYVPPPATGDFGDVSTDYWAAAWIEQLAVEGITAGCGGGNYCPMTPVTRDQMAVFLVKNFNLP